MAGRSPGPGDRDGVQMADVAQNIRNELDVAKQLSGTPETEFAIGRTVGVVEYSTGGVSTSDAA